MKNMPQILYSALWAAYWMLYAATISFSSVYLQPRGYTNTHIGYILCAGFLLGVLAQLAVARAADRSRRFSPAVFLLGTMAVFAVALAGMAAFDRRGAGLTASYVVLIAAMIVAQPLCNSLAFYLERLGCRMNFGAARGIGSLGFAVMSGLLGLILGRYATDVLRYSGWIVLVLMAALLIAFCRLYPKQDMPQAEQKAVSRGLLRRYRGFVWLLAGIVGLWIGHGLVNLFLYQVVQNVGGNETDLGNINAYIAALEIPIMLGFGFIARRFPIRKLLVFSACFFIVKIGGIVLAPSVGMLYLVLLSQCLSFAIFQTAYVYYIGQRMEKEDENSGQAYATAMLSTGNIIASLCGGWLIDRLGVTGTLVAGTAVTALGAACVVIMYLKTKEETV